jgi:hypothetical protein
VTRVLRLTTPYLRAADRLGIVAGTPRGRALGRILARLTEDPALPASGDDRALLPPTREAFVRHVPGQDLWVWYVLNGEVVFAVALTAEPPVVL